MRKPKKKLKIESKKLGRRRYEGYQIDGWADEKRMLIEIDSRLTGKKRLKTIIHESVHVSDPNLTESEVEKIETIVGNALWEEGYRKVEIK